MSVPLASVSEAQGTAPIPNASDMSVYRAGAHSARFFTFRMHRFFSGWRLASFAVAALVLVPVGVVLWSWFTPPADVWPHLRETVLPDVISNTVWLVLGVAAGTALLGVSLAWLTAVCEFPGRRIFAWALLLPLAMPAYVLAFVAVGLLDFTGPVQSALRDWFGSSQWFPHIRSRGGVIAVMTLALYPYVYLIARNAFLTQGRRAMEAAQSLGCSRRRAFFEIALPMARPWIVAGVMLVVMETLADFGTVAVFNYDTFTTAIYKAWFSLFSLPAALQLASVLVLFVFVVLLLEQYSRSRQRYTQAGRASLQRDRFVLRGGTRWSAVAYCTLVVTLAFMIPLAQLLAWAWDVYAQDLDERYWGFLTRSLMLAGGAALLTGTLALILSYAGRRHTGAATRTANRIATLGYALPGPLLAVGVYAPVAWLDNHIIDTARAYFGVEIGQVLGGTLLVMMLAYIARFLAVAYNPVDANMQRITRSIDEAARSVGVRGWEMLRRVHLPILRGGALTAATLVFVDVMKEMPITLMTRPFGWDTLSVRIFEMTSEGEWQRAALPAVTLVLAGLLPIILLVRHSEK